MHKKATFGTASSAPWVSRMTIDVQGYRHSKQRIRFSLLVAFALLSVSALLLGVWRWMNAPRLAALKWIEPSSSEAEVIGEHRQSFHGDGRYNEFEFYPRRASLERLRASCGDIFAPFMGSYNDVSRLIKLTLSDESDARAAFLQLKLADKLDPDTFSIRGIVKRSDGQIVTSRTSIALIRGHKTVDECTSRSNGSFVLVVDQPPGRGYFLHVRYMGRLFENNGDIQTARFSLRESHREMVGIITLP